MCAHLLQDLLQELRERTGSVAHMFLDSDNPGVEEHLRAYQIALQQVCSGPARRLSPSPFVFSDQAEQPPGGVFCDRAIWSRS